MNVTFRQLNAFVKVARLGSFTRAADALHVSQSALTMQIQALEEALGIKLFERGHRSITLTFVGKNLLSLAEQTVAQATKFAAAAEDLAGLNRGVVKVATLPSIASRHVAVAAKMLKETYPGFTLQIRDAVAETVIDLVKKGDVDFGISSPEISDSDVEFSFLLEDRIFAFERRSEAPNRHGHEIPLADLVTRPLILSASGVVRRLFDRATTERGLDATPAFEAVYDLTAVSLARQGLGAAVLSESIQSAVNMDGLTAYNIVDPSITRKVSFVTARNRQLSSVAEAFKIILYNSIHGKEE
jgi:DNA-binding transcriptional LysR family regulator